jgi:hypothetical protein
MDCLHCGFLARYNFKGTFCLYLPYPYHGSSAPMQKSGIHIPEHITNSNIIILTVKTMKTSYKVTTILSGKF